METISRSRIDLVTMLGLGRPRATTGKDDSCLFITERRNLHAAACCPSNGFYAVIRVIFSRRLYETELFACRTGCDREVTYGARNLRYCVQFSS